jgi:threonyl-tRNA synthetase
VGVDARGESLSRKIVDAHGAGVPWVVVVGNREVAAGGVRLRQRDGAQKDLPWDAAVAELVAECRPGADA